MTYVMTIIVERPANINIRHSCGSVVSESISYIHVFNHCEVCYRHILRYIIMQPYIML